MRAKNKYTVYLDMRTLHDPVYEIRMGTKQKSKYHLALKSFKGEGYCQSFINQMFFEIIDQNSLMLMIGYFPQKETVFEYKKVPILKKIVPPHLLQYYHQYIAYKVAQKLNPL